MICHIPDARVHHFASLRGLNLVSTTPSTEVVLTCHGMHFHYRCITGSSSRRHLGTPPCTGRSTLWNPQACDTKFFVFVAVRCRQSKYSQGVGHKAPPSDKKHPACFSQASVLANRVIERS